jgi:polyisoprenoid-binding protein YceI
MAAASMALVADSSAQSGSLRDIDPEKSTMTVRVFKSGLFSAFGHEHEVRAPVAEGRFNEVQPAVELRVDASQLRVVDKDVSDSDRAKVQDTMLGPQVLDAKAYRDIWFRSTRIDRLGDSRWLVHGDLTLHGQTHPVQVQTEGQGGHFRGWAELKQKDFGITPVTVGGGTVKVKNEVRVEFDIVGK